MAWEKYKENIIYQDESGWQIKVSYNPENYFKSDHRDLRQLVKLSEQNQLSNAPPLKTFIDLYNASLGKFNLKQTPNIIVSNYTDQGKHPLLYSSSDNTLLVSASAIVNERTRNKLNLNFLIDHELGHADNRGKDFFHGVSSVLVSTAITVGIWTAGVTKAVHSIVSIYTEPDMLTNTMICMAAMMSSIPLLVTNMLSAGPMFGRTVSEHRANIGAAKANDFSIESMCALANITEQRFKEIEEITLQQPIKSRIKHIWEDITAGGKSNGDRVSSFFRDLHPSKESMTTVMISARERELQRRKNTQNNDIGR